MRLPHVQFSVGRMMLAIAALAVALSCVQTSRWWEVKQDVWALECNLRAERHRLAAMRYRGIAVGHSGGCRGLPVAPYAYQPDAERAAHHTRLARQWRFAESRTWVLNWLFEPESG